MLQWTSLLNPQRFSEFLGRPKPQGEPEAPDYARGQFRLPAERDHDRVLFATPLRRMGDKTQVFPLDSIESIHTRLTHSYEVANLARSIGLELSVSLQACLPRDAMRSIPATLAAVGLAHDIGNPPFGHQGEEAIRSWFRRNQEVLFEPQPSTSDEVRNDLNKLCLQHRNDFLNFEGNAQTLRLLTKLQVIGDDLGLNLTFGTLAALMKYVASSNQLTGDKPSLKKVGYFASEAQVAESIRSETGLQGSTRHPLSLVMEACDDIAYSVIDAEDSIKKNLISFNDLLAWLDNFGRLEADDDQALRYIHRVAKWEYNALAQQEILPGELSDVATQKFRVRSIHVMVAAVVKAFQDNYEEILGGNFDGELLGVSSAANLCRALKDFDRQHAFSHRSVLEIELDGYNVMNELMDLLWRGIAEREEYGRLDSRRTTPFAAYAYSRISRNYRRVFEGKVMQYRPTEELPVRYREIQLLTDMISGMTDGFCIDLHGDLMRHHKEMRGLP